MRTDTKTLTACVLAAAVSAVLCLGLWYSFMTVPFFVFVFGCLISLPILLVAFGCGTTASVFSAVLTALLLFAFLSPATALLLALFFFAPSVFAGWLMGLAQTDRQTGRQDRAALWYPLSAALFQLALVIAIAAITIMLFILSSEAAMQFIDSLITQFMTALRESNFYSASDQAVLEKTIRGGFITLVASALPIYGFLFHLGNLYFSMRLANRLGWLKRPLDDWPVALRMPPAAVFIFVAGWISSPFTDNKTLAICMDIIVSVLSAGFLVSGLALVHKATRGLAWRTVLLSAVYAGLFTLVLAPIVGLGLVVTGLFSTSFSWLHNNGKPKPPHKDHLN